MIFQSVIVATSIYTLTNDNFDCKVTRVHINGHKQEKLFLRQELTPA